MTARPPTPVASSFLQRPVTAWFAEWKARKAADPPAPGRTPPARTRRTPR